MEALDDYPAATEANSVNPPFYTIPEAAERLGISSSNAYRLIRKGNFPVEVVRVGSLQRVRRHELDRFVRGEAG